VADVAMQAHGGCPRPLDHARMRLAEGESGCSRDLPAAVEGGFWATAWLRRVAAHRLVDAAGQHAQQLLPSLTRAALPPALSSDRRRRRLRAGLDDAEGRVRTSRPRRTHLKRKGGQRGSVLGAIFQATRRWPWTGGVPLRRAAAREALRRSPHVFWRWRGVVWSGEEWRRERLALGPSFIANLLVHGGHGAGR
jgi:hypothetical protein